MRAFRAPTLTALHDQLCDVLVNSPREKLDVVSTVDVQIHNVIAEAMSMDWDFDLKTMWLTKSRWSMMARQYIDPDELELWIDKCTSKIGTRGRGIALMRTKTVAARGGPAQGNKESRRWGSCMLAISYKAIPYPQITLYSRTSYLGYLGALDLSVAWMCARYLAKELGIEVEDMRFVWMNEAIQYHNFKSLAYLLNHPDPVERKKYHRVLRLSEGKLTPDEVERIQTYPAIMLTRKWLQKLIAEDKAGKTLGDMTYNTYRRIRRRYHTEVLGYERAQEFEGWSYYKKPGRNGEEIGDQKEFFKAYQPLPHVNIHDLDFSAIGMPITGEYGAEYEGDDSEDADDDED